MSLRNLLIAAFTCAFACAEETQRVVLVGDSTVATKSGWGDGFIQLLKPGVTGVNMGRGGRSSKSYRDEGWWKKALAEKPTWVLIQFGHNDQPGKGPERETDPATTFRDNLRRYIDEAEAAGANPVLVTSLVRRNFGADGKIKPDMLVPYVEATRAVAAEKHVPLIDLYARSIERMNQIGPEAAAPYDAKSNKPEADRTHLSRFGEAETAKLVAAEVRMASPDLAELLTP